MFADMLSLIARLRQPPALSNLPSTREISLINISQLHAECLTEIPTIRFFWSGLASLCYLPATAAPIGLTAAGLPVGLQIIGAEGDGASSAK